MGLMEWIESTGLAAFVRESLWGYPIILTSHGVGMAIVIGIMVMIDLRLLGFAPRIPLDAISKLFVVGWIGVALNVVSGLMLFTAEAVRFSTNMMFQAKLTLLIIGAVTAWMSMKDALNEQRGGAVATSKSKTLATVSVVCLIVAVIAGRMTAYAG
jgi:hypothetical protein